MVRELAMVEDQIEREIGILPIKDRETIKPILDRLYVSTVRVPYDPASLNIVGNKVGFYIDDRACDQGNGGGSNG